MSGKIVMTPDDIWRTLARIAHEIIEQNKTVDDLVLVGMHTRGVPLAQRLGANIERFEGAKIPVGALDISNYRDDCDTFKPAALRQTDIPTDIHGKRIVLVDDVLYTGRSIRAAMDALVDLGRPKCIQLVIFVDRGHREMPIRADYVGKNIPSSRDEEVIVHLAEIDGADEVLIRKLNGTSPPDVVAAKRSVPGG